MLKQAFILKVLLYRGLQQNFKVEETFCKPVLSIFTFVLIRLYENLSFHLLLPWNYDQGGQN